MMESRDRARLEELLAERATQRLAPAAEDELHTLLAAGEGSVDEDQFELAAAAVELALLGDLDEMPQDVRNRLATKGRAWVEAMRRNDR